jgi:ABC-type multidrug transport system fused ATPase/permease subunit
MSLDIQLLDKRPLAIAYTADIERLVGENRIDEALSLLQDFVQSLAPKLKKSALLLRRQHAELREGLINGTVSDAQRAAFYNQILLLCQEATRRAADMHYDAKLNGALDAAASPATVPQSEPRDVNDQLRRYWEQINIVRPAQDSIAIQCRNLSLKLGGFTLQPISLALRFGQILGVVGKNASGKTTLLSLLA